LFDFNVNNWFFFCATDLYRLPVGRIPKSLQIFLAKKELISVCRGTVENRWVVGLKNKLCFAPSFAKTQPCFSRYAIRTRRFI